MSEKTSKEIEAEIVAAKDEAAFLATEIARLEAEVKTLEKRRTDLVGGWGTNRIKVLEGQRDAALFRESLVGKPTVLMSGGYTRGSAIEYTLVKVTPKQIHLTKDSNGRPCPMVTDRAGKSRYDGHITNMEVVEAFLKAGKRTPLNQQDSK